MIIEFVDNFLVFFEGHQGFHQIEEPVHMHEEEDNSEDK